MANVLVHEYHVIHCHMNHHAIPTLSAIHTPWQCFLILASQKNSLLFSRGEVLAREKKNAYKQKASNFQHVLVVYLWCLLFCLAKDRMLFKLILMFVALLWRWYWSCLWLYWERDRSCLSKSSHRANILPGKNGDIQQLPPSRLCLQNPLIRQNKSVPCRLPLLWWPPFFFLSLGIFTWKHLCFWWVCLLFLFLRLPSLWK